MEIFICVVLFFGYMMSPYVRVRNILTSPGKFIVTYKLYEEDYKYTMHSMLIEAENYYDARNKACDVLWKRYGADYEYVLDECYPEAFGDAPDIEPKRLIVN